MEAKKRSTYYQNEYYTQGNTARKLQVVPKYPNEREQDFRQQPVRVPKRKLRANQGIDMLSLLVLTAAIVVTLYTCVEYLRVQTNIAQMNNEIASLESDLTKLLNENKDALSQINTNLDLNYIFQVATTELGMVYPDSNQLIPYESNLSGFVIQYSDIPEESKDTLLDKILK